MRQAGKYSYNPAITFKGTVVLLMLSLCAAINLESGLLKTLFLLIMAFLGYIPFRLFKSISGISSTIKGTFILLVMMLYSYETISHDNNVPVFVDAIATIVGSIIFLTSGLNTKNHEWVMLVMAGSGGYIIPLTASMLWGNAYGITSFKSLYFSLISGAMLYAGFLMAIFSNLLEAMFHVKHF